MSSFFFMRSRTPGSFWLFVKAASSVFMKVRKSVLGRLYVLPSFQAFFWKTAVRLDALLGLCRVGYFCHVEVGKRRAGCEQAVYFCLLTCLLPLFLACITVGASYLSVYGYSSGPRTVSGSDGYSENTCCINNCHPSLPVFLFVGACMELGIHSPTVVGCLALFPMRRKREFC